MSIIDSTPHSATRAEIAVALGAVGAQVRYFDSTAAISEVDLVVELNAARAHLRGILSQFEVMDPVAAESGWGDADDEMGDEGLKSSQSSPFILLDDGRLAVYLSDDIQQYNHVQPAALPAGWRQLSAILGWLRKCPTGAVCLIEEPEIRR